MDNTAIVSDPSPSHYLPGHSKPFEPRAATDAQESMKAKLIAIRRKLVEQVRAKLRAGTRVNCPVYSVLLKVLGEVWRED